MTHMYAFCQFFNINARATNLMPELSEKHASVIPPIMCVLYTKYIIFAFNPIANSYKHCSTSEFHNVIMFVWARFQLSNY
jgi:hypothetical protein